jgi:hypothetical protein
MEPLPCTCRPPAGAGGPPVLGWTPTFMTRHLVVLAVSVLTFFRAPVEPRTAVPATTDLLDRYLHGQFDGVVGTLANLDTFGAFADQLEAQADTWIEAAPPADRPRRELTAATLALEASRLGLDRAWKTIMYVYRPPEEGGPFEVTHWQPPARLLEWGCRLLRQHDTPSATERLWQLASIAVAARSEDFEFLIGLPDPDAHKESLTLYAAPTIDHALHLEARFPTEPRFKLAIGIAEEVHDTRRAAVVFEQLVDDVDVGGEATMRLGSIALGRGAVDDALRRFGSVESKTRDPWVVYLARFLSGRAEERRNRTADAERHYRRALAVLPRAQSATTALATLLFKDGRKDQAAAMGAAMFGSGTTPDPWRVYGDGDDRFWPRLIARLRSEIHP